MGVIFNPVYGTGFRINSPKWYALDGMGLVKTDEQHNQDSAKFKSGTITNVSNKILTVSVAVLTKAAYLDNAVTSKFFLKNTDGAYIVHKILIPTGTSFDVEETYMDSLNIAAGSATETPVIAIWVNEAEANVENPELGTYADVILRR